MIRLRTAGNGARTTVLILNTHDHGDHTGGNEVFGKDAPIIAHENVRKRLQSGTTATGRTVPPNGEEIRAVHVPSGHIDMVCRHAEGHSAVENAIRAGKTLEQMKQEKVLSQWDIYASI